MRWQVARVGLLFVTLAVTALAPSASGTQPPKLKVHISVDMEGIAGVVTGEQLGPTGFEYGRFREFMTREALAAIEAAKAAGATEIIVADSHGNGQNLLIDQFPADVRVIRSWPRRLSMVAGIDEAIDAAIFIGYHAGTNNPAGVRAHTFSSANLTRVAVNGMNMTEGSWNAAIAGQFGVPVVMMSGDDAAIAEVRKLVGNIEAAETKRSLGFHSASTITPQASATLIGQRVRTALGRLRRIQALQGPDTGDRGCQFQELHARRSACVPTALSAHRLAFDPLPGKRHGRGVDDPDVHRGVPTRHHSLTPAPVG